MRLQPAVSNSKAANLSSTKINFLQSLNFPLPFKFYSVSAGVLLSSRLEHTRILMFCSSNAAVHILPPMIDTNLKKYAIFFLISFLYLYISMKTIDIKKSSIFYCTKEKFYFIKFDIIVKIIGIRKKISFLITSNVSQN